jgi:hypothetical protein
MNWYFVSFSADEGWQGCIITQGLSEEDAFNRSLKLPSRPEPPDNGEVMVHIIEDDLPLPPPEGRNRLLNKDELERYLGPVAHTYIDDDGRLKEYD